MSIVDFPQQGTIGASLMPKRYDIEIYQGDTFSFALVLKQDTTTVIDVTGWTALAQIKKIDTGGAAETPSLDVVVGGADGKITISLTDTGTSALQESTQYKYDVQLTDTVGNKRTFIGGKITIVEDITE